MNQPGYSNEWEFTADVASWINELIAINSTLPFSRAKCEQRGRGTNKRRDLTLLDKNKSIVLTGEVKFPFRPDGGSPYNEKVVQDARNKATRAKSPYFFTWNVNSCVLWETFPSKTDQKDRKFKTWDVTSVHKPSHFEAPSTIHAIHYWLTTFLDDFSRILRGTNPIGQQSPDAKFIEMLETALSLPIHLTLEELESRYKEKKYKTQLDEWMRKELGWTIYDDPEGIRDNLERASKFSCYALVNKLVFHEALLKRLKGKLDKLNVPHHIDTAEGLHFHLESLFEAAKKMTGDYETVFGEEHVSIGNRIPFYSDRAVPHWRELINQIHVFNFSKLDYEIIGNIFERLIGPEERHKYGQYYTRAEVVDLINSFCIRKGDEQVMDPACGGGTFLVRAYVRKRALTPSKKHNQLLKDLYGIDREHFATHLTTINLATRDLVDDDNYPQIARNDFFDVKPKSPFVTLPHHVTTHGLGTLHHHEIEIPPLDAVIGNPPYIRQEGIPKSNGDKNKPSKGTKEFYQKLVKENSGAELSGRSDIHCYFWPHASRFLKDNGYLCFITSSQWLDVEYGFKLQEWILRNFEILAVFESVCEPWFVGARVATTVTILRKQNDLEKRMDNIVRFVQLRSPLHEIFAHDGTTFGVFESIDAFRDEILSLEMNTSNRRYRARLVKQSDLWNQGVELGIMMRKNQDRENASIENHFQTGSYYGGKWGVYLRAPDLWFTLMDRYGDKFVPLGKIAEVRFGVKSGKDVFFYPKDCSDECLNQYPDPDDFEFHYGVPRKEVKSGKVKLVRCGEGYGIVKAIESEYLEPIIHSLMDIKNFVVTVNDCPNLIFLFSKTKRELKNTYALEYINWGENEGYHDGATCASRVTNARNWYDLTGHRRSPVLWPKERQYRHLAPSNPTSYLANCRLYEIHPSIDANNSELWGAILNSTIVLLSSLQYGRPVGNEGNWSTMVVDANLMLVPNLKCSSIIRKKITQSFDKLKNRMPMQFISERRMREMAYHSSGKADELRKLSDTSELDMPDRRELDDAVLQLIGIKPKKKRDEIIDALHSYLHDYFESVRRKEKLAIINKNTSRRRGSMNPNEVAMQIYKELEENEGRYLRLYGFDFLDRSKPFDTFDVPIDGRAEKHKSLFAEYGVEFKKGEKVIKVIQTKIPEQDALLVLLANSGTRGLVRVPHEPEECLDLLKRYSEFVHKREKRLWELIEQRTMDEEMQEKICNSLIQLLQKYKV